MATTKTRYVTIRTLNWIPALGMFGPIVYPRYINEDSVYKIVRSGFEVHEHAVTGKYAGKDIKLTVSNFYDEKRFASEFDPTPTAVNTVKNFGAAVDGQAKVVDPTSKTDAIPVITEASATEEATVLPKVATPINSTMSKSQRKKAAKAAAAAARAAAMNSQESTEPEVIPTPSNTEVEETPAEATEDVTEDTTEVTE